VLGEEDLKSRSTPSLALIFKQTVIPLCQRLGAAPRSARGPNPLTRHYSRRYRHRRHNLLPSPSSTRALCPADLAFPRVRSGPGSLLRKGLFVAELSFA